MEYARLGNSALQVSRVGFGCEPLGGMDWGAVDFAGAERAVARALDLGVTLFDTADAYGLGASEERLSKALGARRSDVVISTKGGLNWTASSGARAQVFRDSSPARIREAVEASLRRLNVERIPLYFIHWPDPRTPLSATFEMLLRCQEAGKIAEIGVSNFSFEQIREAQSCGVLAAVELEYSLINRSAEQQVLPWTAASGVGVLAYGALAQGLLSGKYTEDSAFTPDDRRHRLPHFAPASLRKYQAAITELKRLASERQSSPAQIAVHWVLRNRAVTSVIVGVRNSAQIEAAASALDIADLTGAQLTEFDSAAAAATDNAP